MKSSHKMWYSVIGILSQCVLINSMRGCLKPSEKKLNFPDIGNKYGFAVEEYTTITDDDHILKLFRIPGVKKPPVLLMHGFIDSADTFIIRGNNSLAITLARAGYDVWLGNTRGSRYGRQHVYLNPDQDDGFWDFSFHEMGESDLPAIIDFILEKTNSKKLDAIGHSQGNTIFYVLGAIRPEYNDKINILIALSPMCYFNNISAANYSSTQVSSVLNNLLVVIGQDEILGDNSISRRIYEQICGCDTSYRICSEEFFRFAGSDPEELEADFFKEMVLYYPSGSSRKNAVHMAQVALRKAFCFFDYGYLNIQVYNSTEPPNYDLSKVMMKVALLYGKNDGIASAEDTKKLRKQLPNVVEYFPIEREKFNHIDAVWGRHMDKYLFPHIFRILQQYS